MNGIHIADIQTQKKVRGILHPQTGHALDVIAYDVINQPILDGNKLRSLSNELMNTMIILNCINNNI